MKFEFNHSIIWGISLLISLLICPLLPGIINKVKAFFAGRRGPRLLQLYYDLGKLLCKGAVFSHTTSGVLQLAPVVSLAGLGGCILLFPFGCAASPLAFTGDVILFAYLLALGRVLTVLGALDTGSSFEGMGASREIEFSALAEGALFTVIAFLILITGHFSLSDMLIGFETNQWLRFCAPMPLIFGAFGLVLLTEACRVPVDDPETHLELTMIHEAMILDYGGPDMALIEYGAALKLWLLSSIAVLLVLPVPGSSMSWNILLYFGGVFLMAILIGITESVTARFRMLKVPRMLTGALGFALIAILWIRIFRGGLL